MEKSNKICTAPVIEESPSMSFPSGEKGGSVAEKDVVVEIRQTKPGNFVLI
jgi:hypothetical protein